MESKCRGVFFVDSRAGDLDNSFEVSSYARVDAATRLLTNLEPQSISRIYLTPLITKAYRTDAKSFLVRPLQCRERFLGSFDPTLHG
ncbi:MAG: hypothetical protein V7K40_11135 [Nostoc sp.]|uniref:hypothetical protein n=1 Tax=Nostoc sp. TaxID=1180 RepID=UPI002FF500F2